MISNSQFNPFNPSDFNAIKGNYHHTAGKIKSPAYSEIPEIEGEFCLSYRERSSGYATASGRFWKVGLEGFSPLDFHT